MVSRRELYLDGPRRSSFQSTVRAGGENLRYNIGSYVFINRLSHSGTRGKVSRGVGIGSMNALEGPKNVSEGYIARTEVVRGISESDYMTYILNDRMG